MDVDRLALELESFAPEKALETVLVANPTARLCLTSSFQAEDMIVTHLLRKRIPDIAVLFLDTGYHFPQTYEYRDRTCFLRKRLLSRNRPSGFCIAASLQGVANCEKSNRSCARLNLLRSGSRDYGENNPPHEKI